MPKVDESAWDLESGLINDVDGYISNPRFGVKEEYAQAVVAQTGGSTALMFLIDIVDEDGELLGSQGYSVGSGWETDDDGSLIAHPTRKNVVESSMYGRFQKRVLKELGVPMADYGLPTEASTWEGLGFHWMQEEHKTVGPRADGSTVATSLMPTEFLGKLSKKGAKKEVKKQTKKQANDIVEKLVTMAQSMDKKDFQRAALNIPGVIDDPELMEQVIDGTDDGFWATHQE